MVNDGYNPTSPSKWWLFFIYPLIVVKNPLLVVICHLKLLYVKNIPTYGVQWNPHGIFGSGHPFTSGISTHKNRGTWGNSGMSLKKWAKNQSLDAPETVDQGGFRGSLMSLSCGFSLTKNWASPTNI